MKSWKRQICVQRWGDLTVTYTLIHETNRKVIFPSCFPPFTGVLLMTKSSRIFLFCNGLMGLTGELVPPAVYLHQSIQSYAHQRSRWEPASIYVLFGTFCGNSAIIWATFGWKFDEWFIWIFTVWLRDMNFFTSARCVKNDHIKKNVFLNMYKKFIFSCVNCDAKSFTIRN